MHPQGIWDLLVSSGAVVANGHYVYKSGLHGTSYVRKRSLLQRPEHIRLLAQELCMCVRDLEVEVVVGPEKGGMVFAPWIADVLLATSPEVRSTFAERDETILMTPDERGTATVGNLSYRRQPGDHILVRHQRFVLKYEAAQIVRGKKVLVVDDIVTSGTSLREAVEAVRREGGEVVSAACVLNRGGVTAMDLGVEDFRCVLSMPLEQHSEQDCPLCREGVPVNTDLGYGAQFLARNHRVAEATRPF